MSGYENCLLETAPRIGLLACAGYDLRERLGLLPLRFAGRLSALLHGVFGPRDSGGVGILVYHRTIARVPGLPPPKHNVTPPRFREQLSGLRARGYQFWPLQRVLKCHAQRQPVPPRTVVVTFDDGYASVIQQAWPILRELEIPATVFLATAFLDSDQPFPFDAWGQEFQQQAPLDTFRPMTMVECRELLRDPGIELGAHTHWHEDFRGRPAAFRADLEVCLEVLRSQFGGAQHPFAFPYGSPYKGYAGGDLIAAARLTDVCCALSTENTLVDPTADPFRWGRFPVFAWDTGATLAGKLDGWYSWAGRLKQRLLRYARRLRSATPRWRPANCVALRGPR
jgi:peptidoglycan/xylan/chitin deacetylase (PgdA/CDA1 family)